MNELPFPPFEAYAFEIRPLTKDEGGGFFITFPDLPGCMSDGETYDEAIENSKDAFLSWMLVHVEDGRAAPEPGSRGGAGRFVQRLPKSLHARLIARAKQEGVSMNTLAVALLAEGLGKREAK